MSRLNERAISENQSNQCSKSDSLETSNAQSEESDLLSCLNDDLIAELFSYLNATDLLSLRLVSKAIKIKSERKLKSIKKRLKYGLIPEREKLNFLTRFYTNVNEIELTYCDELNLLETICILKQNLQQINYLRLDLYYKDNDLLQISKTFPDLKHLEVNFWESEYIKEENISLLLLGLSSLEAIKFSNYSNNNVFISGFGSQVIKAIASLHYIVDLTFTQMFISGNHFSSLMKAKGKHLKCLRIVYSEKLVDASLFLQEIFNNCAILNSLHCAFYDSTIVNLKSVNIPSLTDVYLSFGRLTLSMNFEKLESVENLTLCSTQSKDDEFARILSCFPNVKYICLRLGYSIDIYNITYKAVSNLKNLRKLKFMSYTEKDFFNVKEIVSAAQRCVDFNIDEVWGTLSDSKFTTLLEVFENLANERSNEVIKLRFKGKRTLPRSLPENLKLSFIN
ncbi:hypothetical protein B4U79_17477 [Dinothrombium tinctorium]|uniref:F-box domain-containing protein n=1 Tax=Dinothrombium tinctorium TaxID=1965070 RepID=A0A3S3S957_9ACAR|nr:hypothetical protein B4U79_17477 [Dinothrombium tinctorium]